MKIVQIEDFFHPEAGYQVNILSKYLSQFGHDVTIITSEMSQIPQSLLLFFGKDDIERKDQDYCKNTGVKIIRLPIKSFISGRAIFGKKLINTISELEPDIVYAHGNDTFSAMSILKNRRKIDKPLIFDNHMLKMASKNKLSALFHLYYRVFYTPIIKRNKYVVIRTQNDPYVNKYLGIPLAQAPWISYGSDIMIFHRDDNVRKDFRNAYNLDDNDFVVVYAGKLDESKGGKFLADAFAEKFESKRRIVLVCVGNTVGEYGKNIENVFSNSQNLILRFPTQKYTDLPRYFQCADLCVFPKQCSLSFYDVQSCGVPVLSEANNINLDRCSHNNGWNFGIGDIADFRNKILFASNLDKDKYHEISSNCLDFIKNNYNYEHKAREYENYLFASVGKEAKNNVKS